jgi:flagellum-specific peptidoglycan hydrolase FlgJ
LSQKDYKGWARGLSKAGYATDKNYAKKLIRIIETLDLYQFDA